MDASCQINHDTEMKRNEDEKVIFNGYMYFVQSLVMVR